MRRAHPEKGVVGIDIALSRIAVLLVGLVMVPGAMAYAQGAEKAFVSRGEYLFRAAGCASCHTRADAQAGDYLAGGRAMATPIGTLYPPNITPHPEHGLGRWTLEDFQRAVREGLGPGGRRYLPAFPYPAYQGLERGDVEAMWAYLKTVPAVDRPDRKHRILWPFKLWSSRWLWQQLFLRPREATPPAGVEAERWERGAYLVHALTHCGECHTPRRLWGALDPSRAFAGNPVGVDGERIPNISPHREDGIGKWTLDELVEYMQDGWDPDGDDAGGLMAEVIEQSLSHLRKSDLDAIAYYLLRQPPHPNLSGDSRGDSRGELWSADEEEDSGSDDEY